MKKRKAVFVSILAVTITVIALSMNSAMVNSTISQFTHDVNLSKGNTNDEKYIQGITSSPVKEVTATSGVPSDNDRVTSIVVRFQNLVNVKSDVPNSIKINTFQRVYEFGQTTNGYSNTGTQTNLNTTPQFQLYDLPSKDKIQFYKLLNSALTLSQNAKSSTDKPTFDVLIDLYTGDGKLMHTLEYDKCNIITYFLQSNADNKDYRMSSGSQDAEFREATNFDCQGYHLVFPSK